MQVLCGSKYSRYFPYLSKGGVFESWERQGGSEGGREGGREDSSPIYFGQLRAPGAGGS